MDQRKISILLHLVELHCIVCSAPPHLITPASVLRPMHAIIISPPHFPFHSHIPSPPKALAQVVAPHHIPSPPTSSRLKLHHPVFRQLPFTPIHSAPPKRANSPLRPLLIQHSVPTLLASDRVSTLQRHAAVTVAAQVVDRRSLAGSRVALFAACDGNRAAGGGGDVGIARGHVVCVFRVFVAALRGWFGVEEWWEGRRLRNKRREIFGGCGWKAVAELWGR